MDKCRGRFLPLGGGNEIGASCYVLNMGGKKIMLDAGVRTCYGPRSPDFSLLSEQEGDSGLRNFSAVVLSHAHLDHIGAIPEILEKLDGVPIYSSKETPRMMRAQYEDMSVGFPEDVYGMTRDAEIRSRVSNRLSPRGYRQPIDMGSARLTFFHAGHIPGAVMTLIESEDGSVLYTGDFCDFDQYTVCGAYIPRMNIDTLICENTNGHRQRGLNAADLSQFLAKRVGKLLSTRQLVECCSRRVGHPAELAMALNSCMDKGELPDTDIWIDISCKAGCLECEQLGKQVFGGRIKLCDAMHSINDLNGILIHGRARRAFASRRRSPIPNDDILTDNNCCLSNHADRTGILNLIEKVQPKRVILVHGTPEYFGRNGIADEICNKFGAAIEVMHGVNGQEMSV